VVQGKARFRDGKTVIVSGDDGEVQIQCENVVIATGSESVEIPSLPFGENIMSSTDILSLSTVPKTLAVVGGGYIERVLPQYDEELSQPVVTRLEELGVTVLTNAKAQNYTSDSGLLKVVNEQSIENSISAEKVLVTVGRRARLSGWGLEELSLTTQDGCLTIDDAIGDVAGEPMLAHRAMAQGDMVARILAGQTRSWDKQCIPAVCFTDPEIVTAGCSPDEADAAGEAYVVSVFPFRANGRAMSLQREDGFIRVVARKDTNVILGLQAVGAGVSELSAAFSIAIEMGARTEDIAETIHAHPTMSEGLQEACMSSLGHGLHF